MTSAMYCAGGHMTASPFFLNYVGEGRGYPPQCGPPRDASLPEGGAHSDFKSDRACELAGCFFLVLTALVITTIVF